ncbi:MAG: response regulator [Acidobacteriia bacterium]|nr:response regulator [Terriglobia bacterium]
MIVDDTAMNVDLLQYVLNAEGFRTLRAEDGAVARRLSLSEAPDLILLDVVMPGESGFETCAALKSDPRTADIPIIFLSALDDVKSKVRGLKAGGVDFVSKPVHGEEVLARVRVHLRIRENNRSMMREQQARLEQLRDAQRAILVQPEDCPAATAAVKALLRQYSSPVFSPEDAMRGVDAVMRQMLSDEQYLTASYARLNRASGRLTVVGAGHPPLIVIRAAGNAELVEMDGDPLGSFGALTLQSRKLHVGPGDRFYMFSDGLIEAIPGSGRREGVSRLVEACVAYRKAPLRSSVEAIVAIVRSGEDTVADDLLLLGVEV